MEALITVLLVVVGASAGLHYLGNAYRHYQEAESHWRETVELWNRSQRLRAAPETSDQGREVFHPIEGGSPLWRWRVQSSDPSWDRGWEVLHAPR